MDPSQGTKCTGSGAQERIVECSRRLFSEHSFAQVSLKDIAREAGVSVALIVKHFGNKEGLFEQSLDFTESAAALFGGPFHQIGHAAVTETLTAPFHAPYSMARTISISSGAPASMGAIGRRMKADLLEVLTRRIQEESPAPTSPTQPSAELRAQAAVSLLVGLSIMRRFGDVEFAKFSKEELLAYYSQLLQGIIEGTVPLPR